MTDDEYVFNLESELRIALRKLKKTQIAINMMTQNWIALADHYDASTIPPCGLIALRDWRRADVERIGQERDDMSRANVELQERLSAMEDDGK